MLNLLPYALAAYGGYRGYRDSKDQGISGINRLLNTATGAAAGYYGGKAVVNAPSVQAMFPSAAQFTPFTQTPFAASIGLGASPAAGNLSMSQAGGATYADQLKAIQNQKESSSLLNILKTKKDGEMVYSPGKVSAAIAAATYLGGAFDNEPTDIYMPGYNMSYLDLRDKRPGYSYIDPVTGQEKQYEKMYAPEEAGKGDRRVGPYSMVKQRLKTGGLAEIKKFNEGGINYLPSKMTHDENDSNNYVRATGYVEDGAGVGDKDEDTMLAQLADGEFVTRADGVLGAGIIAGANPNSMKDMREKGAQYFYEQQRRYKRVFDLLKDRNGDSKQKIN